MINSTRCAILAKQACATFSQVVQKITPPIANNFLKSFFALFAILTLNAATAWGAETATNNCTVAVPGSATDLESGKLIQWNVSSTNTYSNPIRVYANTTITISSKTGVKRITKVEITTSSTGSYVTNTTDAKWTASGTGTCSVGTKSTSGKVITVLMNGDVTKVTITPTAQTRWSKVIVTYEEVASCDKKVTLTKGSATNGTFTLDKANGSYDNCDEDFVVKVSNVVPTSSSQYCSGVNVTGGNSTVTGPIDGVWTVTYAKENNITSTITPTFADKTSAAITLSEAGATSSVSGKYVGDSYELPLTSTQTCGTKTFVGWSTEIIENSPTKPIAATYFEPDASVTLGATNTFYAVFAETGGTPTTSWSKTDVSDLKDGDEVVLVMNNGSNYTLNDDNGTASAPAATSINIENDCLKDSPIAEKLSWILGKDGDNLTFYKDANKATWLYCTNTNNGVRVGTNTNKIFTIDGNYLKNTETSRYVGVYNSSDWRCYTTCTGNSNIANQTLAFYKKTTTGGYQNYTTECAQTDCSLLKFTSNIAANQTAAYAQNATANTLTISAEYDGKSTGVTYQWYSNTTNSNTNGTLITNATNASYKPSTTEVGTTYYYCVATYDECTITSNVATIVVNPTYTVTFDSDGGSAVTGQTIEKGKTATKPENPEKAGHTFVGWYNGDTEFDFDTPITGNITLKAKWTVNQYKVTLNPNYPDGKTGTFKDKSGNPISENLVLTYDYNTASMSLTDLYQSIELEGYQFNGWYSATSGGSHWIETGVIKKNVTVYAQWSKLHTVTFNTGTNNPTVAAMEGTSETGITLPAGPTPTCTDWTFTGWAEASVEKTTTVPTLLSKGNNYKPTEDCTLYAVYSKTETTLGEGEELSQTLKYDSWSYTGSTTDKGDYRMFHTGSYVESAPFDLSILTKVVVYGGTFGGDKYNSLTIGDGANVWKTVTVTGNSQTGQNTFADGEALSGIGKLRITSNSGTASTTGVRISKIEIYTISSISTTTYNSNPDCTTPEPTKYNVIITPTTNGSVTANHTNAEKGETITLTVTPNDGYILDALTVTDASSTTITVINNEFKMPASNVTVSATFKQDESGEVESSSTATIVFASNANQEDGSSQVITEQTEIDKVVAQGIEFVSGFADVSKVYPNSVHGLKLGTGSAIGKITIGLNISKKVSKITFKTYQYKEKEATIKFSAGGKEGSTSEFGDYTLTFDEPTTVSQIVISTGQASKGRAYVSQIDIELAEDEAGEGGEDPVVPTPTVNPTATFIFNTADGLAKLGVAYPTTADGTSKKTNIENNTTVISNGVGLTITSGTTATRVWLTASGVLDLRVYKGATLTFAVADGFEIIKVDFEGSDLTNLAVDDNPIMGTIWEGNQKSVTFKNLSNVVKINTIAVTVAYTRDVTPGEYGTICIPYGSNNYTGAEFYEVSWLKEGLGLYLDELAANAELVAGKPYIFLATSDEIEIICTGEAVINPVVGEAGLTGTFTKIQDLQTSDQSNTLEGNYMIADNQIWLCGTSCWLNANRAYIKDSKLPKTEQAKIPGRRRVCMGENTTTDFENITNGENNTIKVIENGQLFIIRNGEKYNIQGQKL